MKKEALGAFPAEIEQMFNNIDDTNEWKEKIKNKEIVISQEGHIHYEINGEKRMLVNFASRQLLNL